MYKPGDRVQIHTATTPANVGIQGTVMYMEDNSNLAVYWDSPVMGIDGMNYRKTTVDVNRVQLVENVSTKDNVVKLSDWCKKKMNEDKNKAVAFDDTIKKNEENKKRIKTERDKANKAVVRSYRLKRD